MTLREKSLQAASTMLHTSNYDVAAGLNEDTFTDFLAAHYKSEEATASSVYQGKGRATELGLNWSYHVRTAAKIDLMPIAPTAFAKIYGGWMTTVPELARFSTATRALGSDANEAGTLTDNPPPNVQVSVADVQVVVETDTGIRVELNYGVTVTGFLHTDLVDGRRVVRIIPIAAKVTDPSALNALVAARVPMAASATQADCIALRKLILYLLNVLIANRIGSFVREFSLPVPIEIVKGVTLGDVQLEVVDDLLVVMGRLSTTPPLAATEQAILESGDHDMIMRSAAMIAKGGGTALAEDGDRVSIRNLSDGIAMAGWPKRGLFVILHERLFQAFAATVGYQTSAEQCRSAFGLKGCVGYALRVWGVTAAVTKNGLEVAANFAGSGWLRVCISTHCGDKCHKVSANPEARPRFNAIFTIRGRELWMKAAPGAFDVRWRVGGLPWPFNKLIEWALQLLTSVALLFARVLNVQFERQLTSFPDTFPGTELRYDPTLDRQLLKDPAQPALIIAGEIDFLP